MKRAKRELLHLMKSLGLFAVARRLSRDRLRILCYHGAWRGRDGFRGDSMFIKPETFSSRLSWLRRHGFNVLTLDQAIAGLMEGAKLPPDSVVITIDDGWYSTYADMLPALKHHGMPATLYCDTGNLLSRQVISHVMAHYLRSIHAGSELKPQAEAAFRRATDLALDAEDRYCAALEMARELRIDIEPYLKNRVFDYMTPAELAEAHAAGLSVELHTHRHSLDDFSPCRIEEEVVLNRQALATVLDRPESGFRHFCYPSGKTAPGVGAELRKLGIISATTLESGSVGRGSDPMHLSRILDGDHLSAIEFEAQLCGVGDFIRGIRRVAFIRPQQSS